MSDSLLMELCRVQALACVRCAFARTPAEWKAAGATGAALTRVADWYGDARSATLGDLIREHADRMAGGSSRTSTPWPCPRT